MADVPIQISIQTKTHTYIHTHTHTHICVCVCVCVYTDICSGTWWHSLFIIPIIEAVWNVNTMHQKKRVGLSLHCLGNTNKYKGCPELQYFLHFMQNYRK